MSDVSELINNYEMAFTRYDMFFLAEEVVDALMQIGRLTEIATFHPFPKIIPKELGDPYWRKTPKNHS